MNDLEFLTNYERAKEKIRNRKEFIDFTNGITNDPSIRHLREIEIIQEALQETCKRNYNI